MSLCGVGRQVLMTYVPALTLGALEQYCARRTRSDRLVSMVGAAEPRKAGNRKREDNRYVKANMLVKS